MVTFPEVIGDALDEPAKRGGKGERKSEVALHTCSVLNSEPVSDFPLELEAILPLLPLAPNNS